LRNREPGLLQFLDVVSVAEILDHAVDGIGSDADRRQLSQKRNGNRCGQGG
jgi:hypothetical protein